MNDWESAIQSLSKITIHSNPKNQPVTIHGVPDDLKCIGVGTDAAVFQSPQVPAYAYKKYAADKKEKVKSEAEVYEKLGASPYFSKCFHAHDDILVISYEEGPTLFDCILQGIHIPKQVIMDVEDAREYVRSKGLNPRDIHLKNILLQQGRAKILDVSEYIQPGNDYRWEHLKKGYELYYHLIDGKPIPFRLVETVRKWYNQRNHHFSFDDFSRKVLNLLYKNNAHD
ncbi:serine/threonine protein kinase [Ureibacillus endophyticus]|uniref:Serine/threonine protein kinase n=1 Tax=Ureibacillus endophyticus TaxID=1978490 RepID=A0A494YU93_9BACL|nr:serine/threonine protein kinase [Lysinibacillus endophyticus]RKQ13587.1 serine/threonine protein kinase [Lysinibacillus endophyticus]